MFIFCTAGQVSFDVNFAIILFQNLLEICERSEAGRKFLNIYSSNAGDNLNTPECRKYIKDAVVEYFFVLKNGKITSSEFSQMVQIICNQLPNEDPKTWYTPKMENKAPGGLLFTRYKYILQNDKRFKKHTASSSALTPKLEQQPGDTKQDHEQWNKLSVDERDQCLGMLKN